MGELMTRKQRIGNIKLTEEEYRSSDDLLFNTTNTNTNKRLKQEWWF
jgi:hypothetical protein